MANTWFIQFREDHAPSTALATCGKRLIEEFSSPLSGFETIAQLRDERKRPMETYREYADCLVNMAGSLEGGIKSSTNVRFALDAFARNAWSKFTTSLKIAVDEHTRSKGTRRQVPYSARAISGSCRSPCAKLSISMFQAHPGHARDQGGLLLVCLYVDDILVAHSSDTKVEEILLALSRQYAVKDLGTPDQFIGMQLRRPAPNEMNVSQARYITELLHRFAMDKVRPSRIPMVPNTRLDTIKTIDEAPRCELTRMRRVPYRAVGALLYLARVSHPDIAFTVNQLARH
ncbi:hypothetical protein PR003_g4718 [Phytophthora rubi]|uniref:Reverse transcriptase Ty1/copia-type domain-containing protein n=1 Tax=Phytophthora rubi TaxID=129364 RepID=A0A6A4FXQ3_9STRA|nr:hypothetical protein PR001_g4564 [Phytophthora rubi]KAE9351804.1 hypothetical protein PR003_g4718 [Phytophthora rubi]